LRGFTLLEVLVVMTIAGLTLAIGWGAYARYVQSSGARTSAQLFVRDLSMARATATRTREPVLLRFHEDDRSYEVVTGSGEELVVRSFGTNEEVSLSALDLEMPGDSLRFDARGLADLSGISEPLGRALFTSGERTVTVSFNAAGASRVDEP